MSSKETKKARKTKVSAETTRRKASNQSRVNKIKQVQKEELRKKFKAAEYITQMEQAYNEYCDMLKELDVAKIKKVKAITDKNRRELQALNMQMDIIRVRLDIIKGKIDLNLRRLKFCLPELKAVELSDPEGNNPMSGFFGLLREALQKE